MAHEQIFATRYTVKVRTPALSFLMETPRKKQLFSDAYEAYSDAVFRHCYFRLSNRQTAENLTQETFMRAWEYLKRGSEVKNMRAFLYKIANNLIIDKYRMKKSLSLETLQESGVTFSVDERSKFLDHLEAKEVVEILKKLDKKYQEVIVMRFVEELSPSEIGEVLGASENTVSVRIHRGLKKLRELL